jgi:hypothetical protein
MICEHGATQSISESAVLGCRLCAKCVRARWLRRRVLVGRHSELVVAACSPGLLGHTSASPDCPLGKGPIDVQFPCRIPGQLHPKNPPAKQHREGFPKRVRLCMSVTVSLGDWDGGKRKPLEQTRAVSRSCEALRPLSCKCLLAVEQHRQHRHRTAPQSSRISHWRIALLHPPKAIGRGGIQDLPPLGVQQMMSRDAEKGLAQSGAGARASRSWSTTGPWDTTLRGAILESMRSPQIQSPLLHRHPNTPRPLWSKAAISVDLPRLTALHLILPLLFNPYFFRLSTADPPYIFSAPRPLESFSILVSDQIRSTLNPPETNLATSRAGFLQPSFLTFNKYQRIRE